MSTQWALTLIHFLYVAYMVIAAWVQRRKRRPPKPLKAQRSKIPKHLCLHLVANDDMPAEETQTAFLQCLQRVAAWCRMLGIQTLTVFDSCGVLHGCSDDVYPHVFPENETSEDSYESEIECPLTPPPSDYSGSRTPSPEHATFPADLNALHLSGLRKRRNIAVRRQPKGKGISSTSSNLTLYIASSASGKPAIASASRSLLQSYVLGTSMSDDTMPSKSPYKLEISELAKVLEAGLPPPDFIIIHHIHDMKMPYLPMYPPIEFRGFPPWQINLAEFQCM